MARDWFLASRRIEMGELADTVGVNRATLFRWVGGRDELVGLLLGDFAIEALTAARAYVLQQQAGRPGHHLDQTLAIYCQLALEATAFRDYLARDGARALRLLTTRDGPVQQRVVEQLETYLVELAEGGLIEAVLPIHELAYLLVRIVESYLYTDLITGEEPDSAKVARAVSALLRS